MLSILFQTHAALCNALTFNSWNIHIKHLGCSLWHTRLNPYQSVRVWVPPSLLFRLPVNMSGSSRWWFSLSNLPRPQEIQQKFWLLAWPPRVSRENVGRELEDERCFCTCICLPICYVSAIYQSTISYLSIIYLLSIYHLSIIIYVPLCLHFYLYFLSFSLCYSFK